MLQAILPNYSFSQRRYAYVSNVFVGIAVVAAVSVVCLTAGVNFALKKIRGVISKAS